MDLKNNWLKSSKQIIKLSDTEILQENQLTRIHTKHFNLFDIRWLLLGLLTVACTFFFIVLSRIPTANFAELSPFWPVTGLAIGIGRYRLYYLFWVGLGLFFWSLTEGSSFTQSLLLPLILLGPLSYLLLQILQNKQSQSETSLFPEIKDYALITFTAILPSAIIGSFFYQTQLINNDFIDILFIYVLSDFLGVLIFYPLIITIVNTFERKEYPSLIPIVTTAALACLPSLFYFFEWNNYGDASKVLIFPLFALLLSKYNYSTLVFSSFIFSILFTFTIGLSINELTSNQQVASLLYTSFWLIAVLFTTQALHEGIRDKKILLDKSIFQAFHNERTNKPNKRKLKEQFASEEHDFLTLVQIKDRRIINQTMPSEDIEHIEKIIATSIEQAIPNAVLFHVSELRYALLTKDKPNIKAKEMQDITIELPNSELFLHLAWGVISCIDLDFNQCYSKANAALNIALNQPVLRIYGPEDDGKISEQLSQFDQYQLYLQALETDGLLIYFQEISDIQNKITQSAEILARMNINGELVPPIKFLEIFKKFDALSRLDRRVIELVFEKFQKNPLPHIKRININITGATLSDDGFIKWLTKKLENNRKPDIDICFEITESDLVRNWDTAQYNSKKLTEMGFIIAIDDFGTGLASFEYLNRFPNASILKLDGAFVKDLQKFPQQEAFIEATMLIARSKNIDVCAEFVDSQDTLDFLKEVGVRYAQGFFIGKPQPLIPL